MKKKDWIHLGIPAVLLGGCFAWLAYLAAGQTLFFSWRRTGLFLLAFPVFSLFHFLILRHLIRPAAAGVKTAPKLGMAAFCILAGAYLLTFTPWDLPMPIGVQHLRIIALAQKHPDAQAAQVELLSFSDAHDFISYNTFENPQGWTRQDTSLITAGEFPAELSWQGRARKLYVSFRTSPDSGKITLVWNGHTSTYDLYNLEVDQQTYPLEVQLPASTRLLTLAIYSLSAGFLLLVLTALFVLIWRQTPPLSAAPDALPPLRSRFWLLPLAGFLIGAGLMLFALRNSGAIISTDTVNYVSAARHLLAGEGYIAENNDVYDWWPPLYPAWLAILGLVPGVKMLTMITPGNAFLYGLIVALSVVLARAALPRARLAAPAVLLLSLFAIPYYESASPILSEPIYLTLTLFFFIFWFQYLHTRRLHYAILFTIAAAGIPLTRYVGVTLILSTAITLLLILPTANGWHRLTQTAAFGFLGSLPTALWVGRNYVYSGLLTGPRTPSDTNLQANLQRVVDTIKSWLVPAPWAGYLLIIILLLVALVLLAGRAGQANRQLSTNPQTTLILAGYAIFYLAYLVIVLSIVSNAPIGTRLLAPVFPALVIGFGGFLDAVWQKKRFGPFLAALLLLMLMVQPVLTYQARQGSVPEVNEGSIPLRTFEQNGVIDYLRRNPPTGMSFTFSNCPRCVYIFADLHPTYLLDADHPDLDLQDGETGVLIWFANVAPWTDRPAPGNTLPDLARAAGRAVRVTSLYAGPDGQVVEVR